MRTTLLIFLIAAMAFLTACSGQKKEAANEGEPRADIITRPAPGQPVLEVTFYRMPSDSGDTKSNKSLEKNVVAVESPLFNDVAMKPAINLAGQPIYKIDSGQTRASNVIRVSIDGKAYEGSTMIETALINKMITITLAPVE